jgi:uncharacterized protein YbjT (DUF2867 family)
MTPGPRVGPGTLRPVLVAGATGYVGGRIVAALECAGVQVRCLARRPEALRDRVAASTEVVKGDCLDPATLPAALASVETAYYLVHSMGSGKDFAAKDEAAAGNFGEAAWAAGVRRIVYVGGLGAGAQLSEHLRSRQQTGDGLRSAGVPVVELRASIVIGSGSLSYEMVRALVERLPVMICPRWVQVRTQPIAIDDLVAYALAARELPEGAEGVYEVGGPDAVSYREIMLEYARQRGLRRQLIPVPFLTPRLSSLWLGLVTPLYARVGRTLIESLRTPTVVTSDRARTAFPDVRPRPLREAIARALSREDAELAATRWSDAVSSAALARPWGGARYGTRLVDTRARVVNAPPHRAFAPVRRLGGRAGWYWGNALWRLRGALDAAAGGAGMRRGRRHPHLLRVGDALDFWRVEGYEEDRLLRLEAEMRLPGRAWLQFEVSPVGADRSEIRQTAIFDPAGLTGLAYWYALYPVHSLIFGGMLRALATRAEAEPVAEALNPAGRPASGR